MAIFFIIIPIETGLGDVDNAVMTAVQAFSNGINPYFEKVVPHFHKQIDYPGLPSKSKNVTIFGTYNYLPVDLLLYSIGHFLFSPLFGQFWYYLTNLVVICFCIIMFAHFYPVSILKSAILFFPTLIFGVLVFNDIWLILFFILFLIWVDKHKHTENHTKSYYLVASSLLTLGFLTKMLLIFILPVFLFYNTKTWLKRIMYALYSAFFSLIVISSFGFYAVINSVILFNSNINERSEVAYIGGILAPPLQMMNLTILYVPIFILSYLAIVYSSKFYSPSLEGKILFVSAIVIVLLPSGNFLPTLWSIFVTGAYIIYNDLNENVDYSENFEIILN